MSSESSNRNRFPTIAAIILAVALCVCLAWALSLRNQVGSGSASNADLQSRLIESQASIADLEARLSEAEIELEDAASAVSALHLEQETLQGFYRSMLQDVDYGTGQIYVIGHTSPDADSVCASIGMAALLNELGIQAQAVTAGEINDQTRFILTYFDLQAPEMLDSAEGQKLFLVDHSAYTHMVEDGYKAEIVGVLDHHGLTDGMSSDIINVRSVPSGSTSTLVYLNFYECGIQPSTEVASILASGIIADCYTRQTPIDTWALKRLCAIAGLDSLDGFASEVISSSVNFNGKTSGQIFYGDYKNYSSDGVTYGIAVVDVATEADMEPMYQRLLPLLTLEAQEGQNDMLLLMISHLDHDTQYIAYAGPDEARVEQILTKAFDGLAEKEENYFVFKPAVSRKSVIVPAINEAIRTVDEEPEVTEEEPVNEEETATEEESATDEEASTEEAAAEEAATDEETATEEAAAEEATTEEAAVPEEDIVAEEETAAEGEETATEASSAE